MIELMKYELIKKVKIYRYLLPGYVFIMGLLIIFVRGFLWNSHISLVFPNTADSDYSRARTLFVITMIVYLGGSVFFGLYSIFEGLYRFNKDLSGKQSVTELMLPLASWKKVISKITANLCCNCVCIGLSLLSILMFFLISSNFEERVIDRIREAIPSPGTLTTDVLYIIFTLISINAVVFCGIAAVKSISHKSKYIGWIVLLSVIGYVALCFAMNSVLVNIIPIIRFRLLGSEDSLSSILMGIMTLIGALVITSWLMDNKTEQ